MIQRQLKVSDPEIQRRHVYPVSDYLEYPPYVSRKGMEAVLAEIARQRARGQKHEA